MLLPGYPGVLDAVSGGEVPRRVRSHVAPRRIAPDRRETALRRSRSSLSIARPSIGATAVLTRTPRVWTGPTTRCASASSRRSLHSWEALKARSLWRPQVVHCNDWQTGLAPAYLHYRGAPRAATVMTVHNLAFHGSFPAGDWWPALGLPAASYTMGRPGVLRAHVVSQGGTLLC